MERQPVRTERRREKGKFYCVYAEFESTMKHCRNVQQVVDGRDLSMGERLVIGI